MKSIDIWALLILSTMPEKPIPLEGVWRSCEGMGSSGDLEYVASFHDDELIEDYFGTESGDGLCGGKRFFHFRRSWKLSFHNFKFRTEYKTSGYQYIRKKSIYRLKKLAASRTRDVLGAGSGQGVDFKNEYTYRIRGETLEATFKGKNFYLKRVEYPFFFKMKQTILCLIYRGAPGYSG
jgi:hypothetical protein